jgi:hypothetical protein
MKALPWIIAGTAIGVAAYVVLNTPGPEYATGNDTLEQAAVLGFIRLCDHPQERGN